MPVVWIRILSFKSSMLPSTTGHFCKSHQLFLWLVWRLLMTEFCWLVRLRIQCEAHTGTVCGFVQGNQDRPRDLAQHGGRFCAGTSNTKKKLSYETYSLYFNPQSRSQVTKRVKMWVEKKTKLVVIKAQLFISGLELNRSRSVWAWLECLSGG